MHRCGRHRGLKRAAAGAEAAGAEGSAGAAVGGGLQPVAGCSRRRGYGGEGYSRWRAAVGGEGCGVEDCGGRRGLRR